MTVIEIIIRTVCREAGITRAQLLGDRRWKVIVHARQVVMWLAHRYTSLSLVRIGHLLKRDHTTVLHAVRKIERLQAGHDDHLAYPEHGRQLLALAERCDAVLRAQLGPPVPRELPTLEAYLAAMRQRHARQMEAWRRESERIREQRRQQTMRQRSAPPPARPPRQVPMSGSMHVRVPPGRSRTGVLLGDPPPGRSALDRLRQRRRISWEARIRAALSISRQKQQEQEELSW